VSIRDWPEDERPRERLLGRGPEALSDAELLAVFLRSGLPGRSAVDLARELLADLGGLRGVLEAPAEALRAHRGLGLASYALLRAAVEVGERYLAARLQRGDVLANPQDARRYVAHRLRRYPHEVFACLFLDNRHRVISFEELFFGTIDGATVHPREVVRRALGHNAAALILAHNHPSGVAEPSRADELLTRRLREALALVDTRVLDHLVIGDAEVVSFAERGLL
jgi:DNA repair protein RadC